MSAPEITYESRLLELALTVKECAACGGSVESVTREGRTFVNWDNEYPVPHWFPIPTCTVCGARYESEAHLKELDYIARILDRDLIDKMIAHANKCETALTLYAVVLPELAKIFWLVEGSKPLRITVRDLDGASRTFTRAPLDPIRLMPDWMMLGRDLARADGLDPDDLTTEQAEQYYERAKRELADAGARSEES